MTKLFTQEQNQDIILAAVNSLATTSFDTVDAYTKAVITRSLTIQGMLREESPVMRIMDSIRLYAHIDDVAFEDSSKRYLMTFTVPGDDAEPEQIRTPRMDTVAGQLVEPIVRRAKGRWAIVYKNNESAPEGAKGRNVPSSGYRVMPWIELLG